MNEKITAIILAGGQGRRFDYQNKGLIEWQQQPLISHVIARIKPQVTQIIISCNDNVEQYQALGYSTCNDQMKGFQGPLAGIQAALAHSKHKYCLICPCDTPRLPGSLSKRLYQALISEQADIAYPVCGPRKHYLPALLKTSLLPALNHYLQSDGRSVKGWYKTQTAVEVNFNDLADTFINVNSAAALNKLMA
jgi:molybdenum cofactor guanylyltransferase